jgi:hypothetical protein
MVMQHPDPTASDDEKALKALEIYDAMAETWAERVGLKQKLIPSIPSNMPTKEMKQRHDDLVERMVKQAFVEGCYEGRRSALTAPPAQAEGMRSAQPLSNRAWLLMKALDDVPLNLPSTATDFSIYQNRKLVLIVDAFADALASRQHSAPLGWNGRIRKNNPLTESRKVIPLPKDLEKNFISVWEDAYSANWHHPADAIREFIREIISTKPSLTQAEDIELLSAACYGKPGLKAALDRVINCLAVSHAQADSYRQNNAPEWQPIISCPTDGTVVVLLVNNTPYIGNFSQGAWRNNAYGINEPVGTFQYPTHWMPLPASPTPPDSA